MSDDFDNSTGSGKVLTLRSELERRAYLLDHLPRAMGTALVLMPRMSEGDMSMLLGILSAVNSKHDKDETP